MESITHNEFTALDNWDVHVMGRRADILELLVGEDVESNEMYFGVAMLTGL